VAPYLSRASLAQALQISESSVDEFVRRGVLPKPERKHRGELVWNWGEVDRRLQSLPLAGRIYVVGFGSYVKIGFTAGPINYRIAGLQTGCPEQLSIYADLDGTVADERALYKRFSALRTYGEWFRREGELAEWIERGCPL
jgi:predicted DNA-binding transcriptional regulator AlpA